MKADYVPKVGDKLKLALDLDWNDPVFTYFLERGELKVGNIYCVESVFGVTGETYFVKLVGVEIRGVRKGHSQADEIRLSLDYFCFPSETISAQ